MKNKTLTFNSIRFDAIFASGLVSSSPLTSGRRCTTRHPCHDSTWNDKKNYPVRFVWACVLLLLLLEKKQLTAQFTAVGGRNFLSELAKREARNEQFQFLKHTHALFSYFTRYVFVGFCLYTYLVTRLLLISLFCYSVILPSFVVCLLDLQHMLVHVQ